MVLGCLCPQKPKQAGGLGRAPIGVVRAFVQGGASSLCPLSDSQMQGHKKFVTDTIVREARKFEPAFVLAIKN
jgi:hypothetical protein